MDTLNAATSGGVYLDLLFYKRNVVDGILIIKKIGDGKENRKKESAGCPCLKAAWFRFMLFFKLCHKLFVRSGDS